MEIETISNVKPNYIAAETPKPAVSSKELVQSAAAGGEIPADEKKGMDNQSHSLHTPSEATIDDAVKTANRKMEHTRCEFSYHKQTNRVSIKVIDEDTDEVIREIPPEKSLDMLQKLWEMAGILVDEKR